MAQTVFPPIGTPGWVDLSSEDPEASRKFYTALFGWTADVISDPNAGGYGMFKLDGKEVAGVGTASERPAAHPVERIRPC